MEKRASDFDFTHLFHHQHVQLGQGVPGTRSCCLQGGQSGGRAHRGRARRTQCSVGAAAGAFFRDGGLSWGEAGRAIRSGHCKAVGGQHVWVGGRGWVLRRRSRGRRAPWVRHANATRRFLLCPVRPANPGERKKRDWPCAPRTPRLLHTHTHPLYLRSHIQNTLTIRMATTATVLRRAAALAVARLGGGRCGCGPVCTPPASLPLRLALPLPPTAWPGIAIGLTGHPHRAAARSLATRAASGDDASSSSSADSSLIPEIVRDPPPKCAADIIKRISKGMEKRMKGWMQRGKRAAGSPGLTGDTLPDLTAFLQPPLPFPP